MNARNQTVMEGLSLLLALLLLAVAPSCAQEARGTIFGHVVDASGATVVGARVSVLNTATGIVNKYSTTSSGDYFAVSLNPGTYQITVDEVGFKTGSSGGLVLQVDQTLRQDFKLQVGPTTETVTVSAEGQMIQAENSTVGQVVTERQIAALPLSGRDFTNLITLSAGVSTPTGGIQTSVFNPTGLNTQFQSTSIDGARPASISYIVDGFTDTDFFFTKPTNLPSADAVQEFKLQNGLYSSQYGFGSAQVNVAIKSGANLLHGTAYDFVQNAAFQPRSPVTAFVAQMANQPKPAKPPHLVQNEFGGNLGGPVVIPKIYNGRDRTFWFFNYDGGRRRITAGLQAPQVPTLKERQGDFSDWPYPIYDPSTTGTLPATVSNPTGRLPFPGNQIPSSRINTISKKMLAYFPQPNTTCQMPCSNLAITNLPVMTDTNVYTGRFDHRINEKNQLWVTLNHGDIKAPSASLFPASATGVTNSSYLFGMHYQRTFTNNLLGDFRVGYSRLKYHNGAESSFGPNLSANLGFQNVPNIPAYYGLPVISVGDQYSAPGTANNGYSQWDNIYEYGANFTYVHGSHKLNIGGDLRKVQIRDLDGFRVNGALQFPGAYTASDPVAGGKGVIGPTAGNGFADLLLGDPRTVNAPAPLGSDDYDLRGNQYAVYIQDDYHATSRLTLNLGLRYEHPALFSSVNNSGFVLDLKTPGGGVMYASQSFVDSLNAPANIKNIYFQCCAPNTLITGDGLKFLPRVGFAFSPFATNRFVVRGGFGIYSDIYMRFYDGTRYDDNAQSLIQANPNYPAATGAESNSPLALNTLWLPPVPLNPTTGFRPPWQYSISTPWPLNKDPYTEQWGLDAQYSLTPDTLLDMGYVGSRSLHQPTQYFFNQATLPTTPDILPNGVVCNGFTDASQAVGNAAGCTSTGSAFQPIDTRVPFHNLSVRSFSNATILSSTYNSMQVRLDHRFSHGLSVLGSYTYSKALDETSEIAVFSNGSGGSNFITDPRHPGFDYGPADFDQKHRLVMSYVYELPLGSGKKFSVGPANWIVGDWQTSGVVTLASALPFSVFCCARGAANDLSGNPFSDRLRANVSGPGDPNFHQDLQHWFDTSRYTVPTVGTLGNLSRNTLRAFSTRQANISFMKEFPITERNRIEYRLDIFNFLSSWHSGNAIPGHKVGPPSTGFGSILPLTGPFVPLGDRLLWTPRQIQMALRYSF